MGELFCPVPLVGIFYIFLTNNFNAKEWGDYVASAGVGRDTVAAIN
jgi:hypothetical protein